MIFWARIGLLCLIPPAWIASASWIYCWIKGPAYPFEFPYAQWLIAAPWWQYNPWTTVSVVAGAVVPTLLFVLIGIALFRMRPRKEPPLYGNSAWADRAQMGAGGIRQSKRLF
jgi:hypothetical protein